MATAGKVAPTPKDKFVNGTAYDKLDVVEYNGTLYIAKKASAGVLPTDTEYWMLAVDLTGKLDTTGDTENNTVTFESGDEADPTAWKNVNVLSSKEKHSSLLKKISTMFSNVRYLYKLLGTTDISALGTVTQALANLDGNVGDIKGIISSLADCSAATVAGYAADALAVKELNSNFHNHLNKNSKYNFYNPSNTEYATLKEFLTNEIFGKSDASFCVFAASDFSDLPDNSGWGFTIVAYCTMGATHVYAYRFLSNNTIYVRGLAANGNWVDDWKQLSFV